MDGVISRLNAPRFRADNLTRVLGLSEENIEQCLFSVENLRNDVGSHRMATQLSAFVVEFLCFAHACFLGIWSEGLVSWKDSLKEDRYSLSLSFFEGGERVGFCRQTFKDRTPLLGRTCHRLVNSHLLGRHVSVPVDKIGLLSANSGIWSVVFNSAQTRADENGVSPHSERNPELPRNRPSRFFFKPAAVAFSTADLNSG